MIKKRDASRIWLTSDQHLGHANIIKYTGRPFDNVTQMDDELIKRWNEVVEPDHTVYHLGDFTLGGEQKAKEYFRQLNGTVHVLLNTWHHDKFWLPHIMHTKNGEQVSLLMPLTVLEVDVGGEWPLAVNLCHYPLAEWDRKYYGALHCFGHAHGTHQVAGRMMDVGVDCHDFYPVSLAVILEALASM